MDSGPAKEPAIIGCGRRYSSCIVGPMQETVSTLPRKASTNASPTQDLINALVDGVDAKGLAVRVKIGNAGWLQILAIDVSAQTGVKRGQTEEIVHWTVEQGRPSVSPAELAALLWTVADDYLAGYKPKRSHRPVRSAVVSVSLLDANGKPLTDYKKPITWRLERPRPADLSGDLDPTEGMRTIHPGGDQSFVQIVMGLTNTVMQFSLRKDEALLKGMDTVMAVGHSAAELMTAAAELHSAAAASALEGERSAMEGALQSYIAEEKSKENQKNILDTEFGQTLATGLIPTVEGLVGMAAEFLGRLASKYAEKHI